MKTKLCLFALAITSLAALPLVAVDSKPSKKPVKTESAKKDEPAQDADKEKAAEITKSLTPAQKTKLMEILNKGNDESLASLPGIGPGRAKAIQKARPFAAPADLVAVSGIGIAALQDIVAHAKEGFPAKSSTEAPAKTGTKKGEAGKGKAGSKPKAKGSDEAKK